MAPDTAVSLTRQRVADEIAQQELPKRPQPADKTDRQRWRLKNVDGVHTWHYLEPGEATEAWPQTYADKYFLGLPLDLPALTPPETPLDAVRNGLTFFERLQMDPGNWGCEYGGPMFLLPGVVITWHVTKTRIPDSWATEIKNYLLARAHPDDGGWGLHIEGESTVFGTAMNYVVLRLVGVEADHPALVRARATLHSLGGASSGPHWAKFWLAVLGVASWDMVNPAPPELWLLPYWVPFAPWRWWVHIRQVFLPVSYIYSRRWAYEGDDVTRSLRDELFVEPLWSAIDWDRCRNTVSARDNYHPKSGLLNAANWLIVKVWNPLVRPRWLAEAAEGWVSHLVDLEDENSDFADLAPVNAPMNTLVCYIRDGPGAYSVRRHLERLPEFVWLNGEGMLVNGTNGVQNWDTAFLIQAAVAAGLHTDERWRPMLTKALGFLDRSQFRHECVEADRCHRHRRLGGWGFSNRDQGYPVSDCISEALKAVILLQRQQPGADGWSYPHLLNDCRIFDAVDTLLTYQNGTGGVGSYEPRRGGSWLEALNAAEVFGRIMVEYDYPECTTACVTALALFSRHWPRYRAHDIGQFIGRAVAWIKSDQRLDGSWYGSWGICFTYAAMFALESLAHVGETWATSPHSRRGCEFLLSKQREDGGWSESYKACEQATYLEHPSGSLVVQTAWAVLGLLEAGCPDVGAIERGVQLIMSRQQPNGEWRQEAIEGVFNKSAMISYPNYKFTFTLKALGMFSTLHPEKAAAMGVSLPVQQRKQWSSH